MSLDEIILCLDVYKDRKQYEMKQTASDMYNLSCMIASFVNRSLVGKQLPTKSECFPDIKDFKIEENRKTVQSYKAAFKRMAERSSTKKE